MFPSVMPTYNRVPLTFEKGEGAYLYDTDQHRYLDFTSGIAVNALGHCHPKLIKRLESQAHLLWHTSNIFRVAHQEALSKKLIDLTFADTVFFANSGSEAIETGLKAIRKFFNEQKQHHKNRVICFDGAFHGRTFATIAAGGQEKLLKGFEPNMGGFDHIPFGDIDAVKKTITENTAAILIEPIQGEGGINAATTAFLESLRELADKHKLLLFFDEVQSGVGRTGKLFAYQWSNIKPDILASAKGLGGGFPASACLTTKEVGQYMSAGSHGSTFGGNPMAMAVADEVLAIVSDPEFLTNVEQTGHNLKKQLQKLIEEYPELYQEVRGKGLMLGLKCLTPAPELIDALRKEGLLTVIAGQNVIRLLPPLIINQSHIEEAIRIFRKASETIREVYAKPKALSGS